MPRFSFAIAETDIDRATGLSPPSSEALELEATGLSPPSSEALELEATGLSLSAREALKALPAAARREILELVFARQPSAPQVAVPAPPPSAPLPNSHTAAPKALRRSTSEAGPPLLGRNRANRGAFPQRLGVGDGWASSAASSWATHAQLPPPPPADRSDSQAASAATALIGFSGRSASAASKKPPEASTQQVVVRKKPRCAKWTEELKAAVGGPFFCCDGLNGKCTEKRPRTEAGNWAKHMLSPQEQRSRGTKRRFCGQCRIPVVDD